MSAKRFNLYEDPPTASSSEEVLGHSSSDEEVDDDSLKPGTEKTIFSDSESGSEAESDHDSINPVKKNQEPSGSKKVKSSSKPAAKKRSSSEIDGAEAKKVKRVVSGEDEKKISGNGGGEETKKNYFQRVWTEEDEIVVLQRIIDYYTENRVSLLDDTNAFYLLVKYSISFDVSKIQFSEKLRSLKKKFENNLGKGKNGEEPTFSKPHDQKAFDLSKHIWGANGIAPETTTKSTGKPKKSKSKKIKQEVVISLPNGKNVEEDVSNAVAELDTSFVKSLTRVGVEDGIVQQAWTMLDSDDRKKFEEEWKVMKLRELKFYSQKSGFLHEVVTKLTEALQRNP